jgi:hypothetical protein
MKVLAGMLIAGLALVGCGSTGSTKTASKATTPTTTACRDANGAPCNPKTGLPYSAGDPTPTCGPVDVSGCTTTTVSIQWAIDLKAAMQPMHDSFAAIGSDASAGDLATMEADCGFAQSLLPALKSATAEIPHLSPVAITEATANWMIGQAMTYCVAGDLADFTSTMASAVNWINRSNAALEANTP